MLCDVTLKMLYTWFTTFSQEILQYREKRLGHLAFSRNNQNSYISLSHVNQIISFFQFPSLA